MVVSSVELFAYVGCHRVELLHMFCPLSSSHPRPPTLSSGLQSIVQGLESAEQHAEEEGFAHQLSCDDDSLQCNEECDDVHASSLDQDEDTSGCSPGVSRPPTQQEIQQMDELDLSINLGSLLGPGDSWMGDEEDQLRLSHPEPQAACAGKAIACKPFQELFP